MMSRMRNSTALLATALLLLSALAVPTASARAGAVTRIVSCTTLRNSNHHPFGIVVSGSKRTQVGAACRALSTGKWHWGNLTPLGWTNVAHYKRRSSGVLATSIATTNSAASVFRITNHSVFLAHGWVLLGRS
jgi:uncharacterized protein YwbE